MIHRCFTTTLLKNHAMLLFFLVGRWREARDVDWLTGDGRRYCKKTKHVTVACVTLVGRDGVRKTFCSNGIYANRDKNFYARKGEGHPSNVAGRECICTQEESCGGNLEAPRCHSEIAALQDLFKIQGGQKLDAWSFTLSALLRPTTKRHVVVHA